MRAAIGNGNNQYKKDNAVKGKPSRAKVAAAKKALGELPEADAEDNEGGEILVETPWGETGVDQETLPDLAEQVNNGDYTVEDVSPDAELTPSQDGVDRIKVDSLIDSYPEWNEVADQETMEEAIEGGEFATPVILETPDGQRIVIDGHHRLSAAKLLGEKVKALIVKGELLDEVLEDLKAMKLRSLLTTSTDYKTRTETYDGREHLVVPVVALVEGVIHAMNATTPELVTAEVYSENFAGWNGRPIFEGHPMQDGHPVSGNLPKVLAEKRIGIVFNSKIESDKLKMEAWIDVERCAAIAPKLLTRLQDLAKIEISVGAFVRAAKKAGLHLGKQYRAAWEALTPDHLALLTEDDQGACSVDMGCGVRAARGNGNNQYRQDNAVKGSKGDASINRTKDGEYRVVHTDAKGASHTTVHSTRAEATMHATKVTGADSQPVAAAGNGNNQHGKDVMKGQSKAQRKAFYDELKKKRAEQRAAIGNGNNQYKKDNATKDGKGGNKGGDGPGPTDTSTFSETQRDLTDEALDNAIDILEDDNFDQSDPDDPTDNENLARQEIDAVGDIQSTVAKGGTLSDSQSEHLAEIIQGYKESMQDDADAGGEQAERIEAMEQMIQKLRASTARRRRPTSLLKRFMGWFRSAQSPGEMSSNDLNKKLTDAVRKVEPNLNWVENYYPVDAPAFVVYTCYAPMPETAYPTAYPAGYAMKQRAFTLDEKGIVTLSDEVTNVEPVVSYEPVAESEELKAAANTAPKGAPCSCKHPAPITVNQEKSAMDFKEILEALKGATPEQLKSLSEVLPKTTPETVVATPAAPVAEEVKTPTVAAQAKPATFEEVLATASADVRESISEGIRVAGAKKATTIKALKDSGKNPYSDEELGKMSQVELDRLVTLAGQTVRAAIDFSGQGTAKEVKTEAVPEPVDLGAKIRANRGQK